MKVQLIILVLAIRSVQVIAEESRQKRFQECIEAGNRCSKQEDTCCVAEQECRLKNMDHAQGIFCSTSSEIGSIQRFLVKSVSGRVGTPNGALNEVTDASVRAFGSSSRFCREKEVNSQFQRPLSSLYDRPFTPSHLAFLGGGFFYPVGFTYQFTVKTFGCGPASTSNLSYDNARYIVNSACSTLYKVLGAMRFRWIPATCSFSSITDGPLTFSLQIAVRGPVEREASFVSILSYTLSRSLQADLGVRLASRGELVLPLLPTADA